MENLPVQGVSGFDEFNIFFGLKVRTELLGVEQTRQLTKRHNFIDWVKRMNCSEETLEDLVSMIKNAPETINAWLEPLPDGKHLPTRGSPP